MTARLPALLALALLLPVPALAQELPAGTERDLWCGLAFSIIAEDAPGDATDEQKALARSYAEGGAMLTDRARAAYLEAGYSDQRLAVHLDRTRAEVAAQVNTATQSPTFSYEECRILLPF